MHSEVTSVETWQTTEAGGHFRTLLERVRRGEWQLIRRRGRAEALEAHQFFGSASRLYR